MSLWRLGRLAATFIAAMLVGPWAAAMSTMAPDAIAILFEADSDRLTREGLVAVDRLAVRAAQCPAGELAASLQPARRVAAALTLRRLQAVRRRLVFLGLDVKVQAEPLDTWERRVPRQPHVLLADVGSGSDVWCFGSEGAYLVDWAQALSRYVEDRSRPVPSFWQRLSPAARDAELALPLAMAALCADRDGCDRRPALYHWLAETALRSASTERKRLWLVNLWTLDEDAEVERFRQRWALTPLTAEERAEEAHRLVASGLPWAVIEQRLLEPGVMRRFAEAPMSAGGPGPHWLLHEATRRSQLDSLDRLLDAAGPAKACLVDAALQMAANGEEDFSAWLPHVAAWGRGAGTAVHTQRYSLYRCDPTARLMMGALCGLDPAEDAITARYQTMWQKWLDAGVTPNAETVGRLAAPAADAVCRLAPVPGEPGTFRGVPNDSRQSPP